MEIVKNEKFEELLENEAYDLNLGTLKVGANIEETLKLVGENLTHISITKSCGCTMPKVIIASDGITINISYDSNKIGIINQWVKERYLDNGTQKEIRINLKGEIV